MRKWGTSINALWHPSILALALESYAAERILVLGGYAAQPVLTLNVLLAGSSFATDLMFTLFVPVCDQLATD